MALADYVILALLAGGVFFGLVATLGLLRLPDFFARTHAASKAETLSVLLTLVAVGLAIGEPLSTVKTVLLVVFMLLTSPTAAHAISRAAYEEGLVPWTTGTDEGGNASPPGRGVDRSARDGDRDGRAES